MALLLLKKLQNFLLQVICNADIIFLVLNLLGGLSSAGRALAWHARGRRFDPDSLHHILTMLMHGLFYIWSHSGHVL